MIYIFTQYDPFFIGEFLREFDEKQVAYTVVDMPNFKRGKLEGVKKATRLYGFFGFAKMVSLYLFKYARRRLEYLSAWISARDDEEVRRIFTEIGSDDVVLSLSAPSRLPVEDLYFDIPKINFHCGALPKYAGMMPIFWQLYRDEEHITITMHDLAHDIDSGEIFCEYKLETKGSLFELSQSAKRHSAHMFFNFISQKPESIVLNGLKCEAPLLTKFPTKLEINSLRRKRRLI